MTVQLLDLPSEILFMIFSWVPSRDLVATLPRVCKQLSTILNTDWYWRRHFVSLSRGQPWIEYDDIRKWQEGCLQSEFALATIPTQSGEHHNLNVNKLTGAIGGLDCVHFMHPGLHGTSTVIAGGSRDSYLYVWRVRPTSSSSSNDDGSGRSMRSFTNSTLVGHRGWVWSLTSDRDYRPQLLYSGAWDHNVMLWDITTGQNAATINGLHKAAVLSLDIPQRDVLISACYDKTVREMDMRTPVSVHSSHKQHTKPVLSLTTTDRYIYSASEDKTVCVWDRRRQGELQRVKLEKLVPSIHLESGMLSVACSKKVHLFNATEGTLSPIQSFQSEHTLDITSVFHNLGMIVTASKDKTVCIYNGGDNHRHLATLTDHHSAATALDFCRNTLATASGDGKVLLWTLK